VFARPKTLRRWINLEGMDAMMGSLDLADLRVAVTCIKDHGLGNEALKCTLNHQGQRH
jgi:hypothetical protein